MSADFDEDIRTMDELLKQAFSANGDSGFRERMRAAGHVAYDMAKIKVEKSRVGFLPLPFHEYIAGLARLAGVTLDQVLQWASLTGAPLDARQAAGIGKLAEAIGFEKDEMLMSVRIHLAEQTAGASIPFLAARRGGEAALDFRECDKLLRQIESEGSADQRAANAALLSRAERAFVDQSHAADQTHE